MAALRPGPRAHPARHRPKADPDRLRGDEPPGAGRLVGPARVPQEQRARRVLLGVACPGVGGIDGRLRPPVACSGDRVRRHRSRCGHCAERPRCPRRRGAHQPRRGGGGVADPLRAAAAVRPRAGRRTAEPRDHRAGPRAAAELPDRLRRRGQLHAAGHRAAAGLPAHRGPDRVPPGQPGHRCLLRPRHGIQLGPADHLRRADLRRGRQRPLLRGGPQPVTCGTPPRGRTALR